MRTKKILEEAHSLAPQKNQLISKLNLTRESFPSLHELIMEKTKINPLKTVLWIIVKIIFYGLVSYGLSIDQHRISNNIIINFLVSLSLSLLWLDMFLSFLKNIFSLFLVRDVIKNKKINHDIVHVFTEGFDISKIRANLSEQKRRMGSNLISILTASTMPDKYIVETLRLYKERGECFDLNKFDLEFITTDRAKYIVNKLMKDEHLDDLKKLMIFIEKELRLLTAHE